MNLVKWMRKNNRQIMAVVVVLIMIGFVGGYGLQQLMSHLGGGPGGVAGYYLDDKRITALDINAANTELKLLRSMFAAEMLAGLQTPMQSPNFKARLLGQILFPDVQSAAMTSVQMYQAMAQGQLDVTGKDIDAFFEQARGRSEIYWILLREEARRAGCAVSGSHAKLILQQMVPQIAPGRGAAQVLEAAINNFHMPEEKVLRVFGDLLGVMAYADIVTDNESVTTAELRALTGRGGEKLSTEFVKFSAQDYVADQNEPAEAALAAQFDKYKDVVDGQVTEDNPYGFGYKLPARVQLEYLMIKNDDVEKLIEQPTLDEMETYYAHNISQFTEELPKDPNNPDAQKQTRPKPYAEVAEQIRGILVEERTDRLANLIVNDAMELAEAGFSNLEMEKATAEDLKASATDYAGVASKLKERHNITAYTGKTGMLSMNDLSNDSHLGMLSVEGQSRVPVGLAKMAFAIEPLKLATMGPFEPRAPRMWENVGPLRDRFGSVLAVVRVTDAAQAQTPTGIDVSYSTKGAVLSAADERSESVHSVRKDVAADCKLLAAMETAKARSQAFVQLLSDKKWAEAVDAYNEQYQKKTDDGKPLPVGGLRSEKLSNRVRMAEQDIVQMQQRYADMPMAAGYIQRTLESKRLNDRLFALLGDERTEAKDLNATISFEPGAAYYVVKDISVTPVSETDYAQSKAMRAFSLDAIRSQSAGLIHFRPDNIMARLSFRWAETDRTPAATPAETKESQEAAL